MCRDASQSPERPGDTPDTGFEVAIGTLPCGGGGFILHVLDDCSHALVIQMAAMAGIADHVPPEAQQTAIFLIRALEPSFKAGGGIVQHEIDAPLKLYSTTSRYCVVGSMANISRREQSTLKHGLQRFLKGNSTENLKI